MIHLFADFSIKIPQMFWHKNMQTGTHLSYFEGSPLSLLVLSVCRQCLCLSCKLQKHPWTLLFWMTSPVMTPACFNTGKSMSFFFQYIAVLNHIHQFSAEKAPKHFVVRKSWSQNRPLCALCDIYVLHNASGNGNTASEMFPCIVRCVTLLRHAAARWAESRRASGGDAAQIDTIAFH